MDNYRFFYLFKYIVLILRKYDVLGCMKKRMPIKTD